MRRHSLILTLILGTLGVFAYGMASARDRALVVGIDHYPGLSVNGTPANDLTGAVVDANTFKQLLADVWHFDPADIKFLSDQDASRQAILDAFEEWLVKGSLPNDRVVFYFSGHGATVKVPLPGGGSRDTSTIVTASSSFDAKHQVTGMIEGRTIGSILNRIRDRRIMVVADSCHSGSVTRGLLDGSPRDFLVRTISPSRPVNVAPEDWTKEMQSELKMSPRFIDVEPRESDRPDSFVVWSAAAVDQLALEMPNGAGGLFTQTMANGLRGNAADANGSVTAGHLFSYIQAQSSEFCRNPNRKCIDPTPELQAPPSYKNLVLIPGSAPPPHNTASQAAADAQELLGHKNDFDLKAEILPGPVLKTGARVRFRVTSDEAGTLLVLDANSDGSLRQIFPNEQSLQAGIRGQLRAGFPLTVPDAQYGQVFTADTVGKGTLLVLVAEKALDLSGITGKNLTFESISNPRGIVVELASKVQAPLVTPSPTEPNRPYRWAFVAVPYEVTGH